MGRRADAERTSAREQPTAVAAALRTGLERLPGIGPKRARAFAAHGILTVGDLLYHLPFRYEDRRTLTPVAALRPGVEATSVLEFVRVRERRTRRAGRFGISIEADARDATGQIGLVWFNQPVYTRRRYRVGVRAVVHGRVEDGPRFVHPEIEFLEAAAGPDAGGDSSAGVGRVVPIYRRPGGIAAGIMRRLVGAALEAYGPALRGALPAEIAARHGLMDLAEALAHLHGPPAEADATALNAGATPAHRSLAFDELLCFELGLAARRAAVVDSAGIAFPGPGGLTPLVRSRLPFALTRAQERVVGEVYDDMAAPRPMHRLLQGDVGSGKTVVALLAALVALDAGYQAAVMAPTEILAEQHHATFTTLLSATGVRPHLLTAACRGVERRRILDALAAGAPALVIGTQAIIQRQVAFARLGLVVIDEQHRFGVIERARLGRSGPGGRSDAARPDVLVMTATPIPRTLTVAMYGDLDVSRLDEAPPGRAPVATRVVDQRRRDEVYRDVRELAAHGEQGFVVVPLVEESEALPLRAATATVAELERTAFAGLRVGMLHGRMPSREKERVMEAFRAHRVDVLVATSVIEVGIDVPGAAVMVVEDAERFGLAQLHQLRGRVGRGGSPARCYLIASSGCAPEGWERLRVMETTYDGFAVAEADLALRGPGEFLGTRQAGLPEFRVARLLGDVGLVEAARHEARALIGSGGDDAAARHRVVRAIDRHPWAAALGLAEVG